MRFRQGLVLLTAATLVAGACDTDGTVFSSPWSRIPDDEAVLGGAGNQMLGSVTSGGPGLVAVGWGESGGDQDAAVWTSPDGITWSRIPHDEAVLGGAGDQLMVDVTVGGPGLVAVGWDGPVGDQDAAVWTSPDGITWSRAPHNEKVFGEAGFQGMFGVTVGGPGLVAVGVDDANFAPGAAVWTSPDGITWSRVPHDEAGFGGAGFQAMGSVTSGGPGLVAVGSVGRFVDSDAAVWTSADGVTWSRVPHDDVVFGGAGEQRMRSVTAGGPGLIAVGWDGLVGNQEAAVWTSPDGITWSRVPRRRGGLGRSGSPVVDGGRDRRRAGSGGNRMGGVVVRSGRARRCGWRRRKTDRG